MSNSDKSASARTRQLRNRTLAYYYDQNPNKRESMTNTTFDQSAHTSRVLGQYAYTVQTALKPNTVSNACCSAPVTCTPPGDITNFSPGDFITPVPPPYDTDYAMYYSVSWDPVPGATSYTLTSSYPGDLVVSTGTTTANIYISNVDYVSERVFTLTAYTNCGNVSATAPAYPCFLEGALVTMADLSTKPIEFVCVGDQVLGAFGEINTVLALHRPLLGEATMCRINDEHSTTNHHPHISVDKKFYCGDPALVSAKTYGMEHDVLLADGVPGRMFLHGLQKERIHKLTCGVDLKTVDGSRIVRTLETYTLPPETQLYNLVVGGSHTYYVEGYAVTGWPREDDFDYNTWTVRA